MTPESILQQLYRLTAPRYDTDLLPVFRPLAASLLAANPLRNDALMLDIGSGTGIVPSLMTTLVEMTIGLDNNFAMLQAGLGASACLQADANTPPFSANTFDAVCSSFGLSESDPDYSLAAIYRILKPGAIFFLQEWAPYTDTDPRYMVDAIIAEYAVPEAPPLLDALREAITDSSPWHMQLQDAEDYHDMLAELGFVAIDAQEHAPVPLRMSTQAFMQYALGWAPRALEIEAMHVTDRAQCIRTIQDRLNALCSVDGRFHWQPNLFRLSAKKSATKGTLFVQSDNWAKA